MTTVPSEIIKLKRDKKEIPSVLIRSFISEFVKGTVTDYQMSAFLMAVYFNGMTKNETWALTSAMLHSGLTVDLSSVSGHKIDKHSTGGVGDKTSLIVGPIAAACGIRVPMISGRGLGHTGGTLDKLESIPGFSTQLSLERFKNQVAELGVCFIGQTKEICPADRRMYALRDVTGTVESRPLICSSIMSKKLAEGIDGLVLDVKVGSGAFMKDLPSARALAKGLIDISKAAKKSVVALLTDMSQPLGKAVGNSLEVQECLDILQGSGPADLKDLCLILSAHMIHLGKGAKTYKSAMEAAEKALHSGAALEIFKTVVGAQGGAFPLKLPRAQQTYAVLSPKSGFVSKIQCEQIGLAALLLGAGRVKAEDQVDPSAGLVLHAKIGDPIQKGEALATLHFNGNRDVSGVKQILINAIQIRLQKTKAPPLIRGLMESNHGR